VLLTYRKAGEPTLFYVAEVIKDGYYVKWDHGFRDTNGEHQKDRWVDVQIAGLWNSSMVWRSEGWEAWSSQKVKDRISIDVAANDRLREKRELEAAKENADKTSVIRKREEKKHELLRQVEVLNAAIKALD
jgi:hypothetical protein